MSALSKFQAGKLLVELKKIDPNIQAISSEYVHVVRSNNKLNEEDVESLDKLLAYGSKFDGKQYDQSTLISPRIGTISPWSSKATSIAKNANLGIDRIERLRKIYFLSSKDVNSQIIIGLLLDKMTETILDSIEESEKLFFQKEPKLLKTINIQNEGKKLLERANLNMGLALSEHEIDYLLESYSKINRNPTDLELMMFSVVNSEHCRHKIFNAKWNIDGTIQPKSLFKMIKNTYESNSDGILSAYHDNSAVIQGFTERQISTDNSGMYTSKEREAHSVIKVETHNHPTAIAPYQGGATGSGGEIRDENATGRGAVPKIGLTGYSVSNLNIPTLAQPWEGNSSKPERISSPLDIMLEAPIGGAAFNNEFGRPNVSGYFRTMEQEHDGQKWGYHKPIMIAGGLGKIYENNVKKEKLLPGDNLIVLGGPAMLIGLAGGAASSLQTGDSSEELDFASVQRANAEMQRRAHEVIKKCSERKINIIKSIHDVGAGGLSNAIPELVDDSNLGAQVDLRQIDSAETELSPMEIWCNEAQERYVLGIDGKDIELFKSICAEERCPAKIVGKTTKEKNLVINDSLYKNTPCDIPLSLLFGSTPKIVKNTLTKQEEFISIMQTDDFDTALKSVLQIPAVGSKKFLITIGDRNVGGLTARDQMVGPWQVPVADCSVSATGFEGKSGQAMSVGERPPLALINSPAAARMSISEAVLNIVAADIEQLSDIKLSANWMAASGYKNEDKKLYDAVKAVGEEFCPELGLTIPVGKDSLSMRTVWQENEQTKSVASPVSLVVSAFSNVDDINSTLTPQIDRDLDSQLVFIDLANKKTRLGGSAYSQSLNQLGDDAPDAESTQTLKNIFDTIRELRTKGFIKSYHDRSDGGLITTILEMSFASHCGLSIDTSELPGKNIIEKLLNEELGLVIQIESINLPAAEKIIKQHFNDSYYVIARVEKSNDITINNLDNKYSYKRSELEKIWSNTSYHIQKIRDNNVSADQEYKIIDEIHDPGINPKITFKAMDINYKDSPRVAILREQGVNGHNEMAAAFLQAGFAPVDVHMTSLYSGKTNLDNFSGLVACGGFSYGDVLGAGQGWAKNILLNSNIRNQFRHFFEKPNTFSLGVCNGCQMLSGLKELIPGAELWPKFLKNTSEQFEARFVSVKFNDTKSIFFNGMEDTILPVPVAHGEGRALFNDPNEMKEALHKKIVTNQFTDNHQRVTDQYPYNPNGSPEGIAGLCSEDGRSLIMMPHPERAFMTYQNSWHPKGWSNEGPWLQMFKNARKWVG